MTLSIRLGSYRQFDYHTVSDVILHLSYTAEFDGNLSQEVEHVNELLEGSILKTLKRYLKPLIRQSKLYKSIPFRYHPF